MQNPCACRESHAGSSLRQVSKILHRVRTSWLLVISHTLLMPNVKGLSNSSVYLKQADWSYNFLVPRKLRIVFQYRNKAAPKAKIWWYSGNTIHLFNGMVWIQLVVRVQQEQGYTLGEMPESLLGSAYTYRRVATVPEAGKQGRVVTAQGPANSPMVTGQWQGSTKVQPGNPSNNPGKRVYRHPYNRAQTGTGTPGLVVLRQEVWGGARWGWSESSRTICALRPLHLYVSWVLLHLIIMCKNICHSKQKRKSQKWKMESTGL